MMEYIVITYIIGVGAILTGAVKMICHWEFGIGDRDVLHGAYTVVFGLLAPLTVPIALVFFPCYGLYKVGTVLMYHYKKTKEN